MPYLLLILFAAMIVWGFAKGPLFNPKSWDDEKGVLPPIFFGSALSVAVGLVGTGLVLIYQIP